MLVEATYFSIGVKPGKNINECIDNPWTGLARRGLYERPVPLQGSQTTVSRPILASLLGARGLTAQSLVEDSDTLS